MQVRQLLELVQVAQGAMQAEHSLFVRLAYVLTGQLAATTQFVPVRNTLGLIELRHERQVVWEVEQVWQGDWQGWHTCAMEVYPAGQLVRQEVWYRFVVELQERQAV